MRLEHHEEEAKSLHLIDQCEGTERPGWWESGGVGGGRGWWWEGLAGQVLEAPGSFRKELSAKGSGDPQEGSETEKVMVRLASVSWALLAGVHSGPPSPPNPHPAGAHSPVAPAAPSP